MNKLKQKKIIIFMIISVLIVGAIFGVVFLIKNNSNESSIVRQSKNESNTNYLAFIEEDIKNNCYVYIDQNGKIKKISNKKYKLKNEDIENDCIIVRNENNKNIVVDSNLKLLLDESYNVSHKKGEYFTTYTDEMCGVIDKNKNIIVPTKYQSCEIIIFENNNDLCGVIAENSEGNIDIYMSGKGKVVSNIQSTGGVYRNFSFYGINNDTDGIIEIEIVNKDNKYEKVCYRITDGKEIARDDSNSNVYNWFNKLGNEQGILHEVRSGKGRNDSDYKWTLQFLNKNLKVIKKFDNLENTEFEVLQDKYVQIKNGKKWDVYGPDGNVVYTSDNKIELKKTSDGKKLYIEGENEILNSDLKPIYKLGERETTKDIDNSYSSLVRVYKLNSR